MNPYEALQIAATEVLAGQNRYVSIPKRFSYPMREIWQLQLRFEKRNGRRPQRLMGHPRFRAAYDFYLLRAEAGEADQAEADWWIRQQEASLDTNGQQPERTEGQRPRRRRRRRRPKQNTGNDE